MLPYSEQLENTATVPHSACPLQVSDLWWMLQHQALSWGKRTQYITTHVLAIALFSDCSAVIPAHPSYAPLMNPNKDKTDVCGSPIFCMGWWWDERQSLVLSQWGGVTPPQIPQLWAAAWSRQLLVVSMATEGSEWHCVLSKETWDLTGRHIRSLRVRYTPHDQKWLQ